jgi:hypothetical protein
MNGERQPTASEVLDLMDRLQRDEQKRLSLYLSVDIMNAAVEEGLVGRGGIDRLAGCMQELCQEGLIAYSTQNALTIPGPVWDGSSVQQMHGWRVTAEGRRDASLYRQEVSKDLARPGRATPEEGKGDRPDAFISHAGEDKEQVARPLAEALDHLGWDVWLDELRLTVGDSLSRQIDSALVKSRFGIVILSPMFFAKEWPQRELAGLAARELATGDKVILPVWHEVDHSYIADRAPTLADRLGTRTSVGMEKVAQDLSVVLAGSKRGDSTRMTESYTFALVDSGPDGDSGLFRIPSTVQDQMSLIRDRPEWWEFRLYAGVLMHGRLRLEDKWHDHDLRLPGGSHHVAPEPTWKLISSKMAEMRQYLNTFNRVFDPEVLERAFGVPGEEGDPDKIKHVAEGVIRVYESMMNWAAELRNTSVPGDYVDLNELTARMTEGPVEQIRDFIQLVADRVARIPILTEQAKKEGATAEAPMEIELALVLEIDSENQKQLDAEIARLQAR